MFRALAVVFLLVFPLPGHAETPEEKAAQEGIVASLETRSSQLDAEIRELASGRIGKAAADGLAARVGLLTDKFNLLTEVSEELGAVNPEFPTLRQQVAAEQPFTFIDLSIDSSQDASWNGVRKLIEMAIKKRAPNTRPPESEALATLGIFTVKDISEWLIRDMVRAGEAGLIDVLRLIQTFRAALAEDEGRLERVQELRREQSGIFSELERERAKLVGMQ